MSVDLYIPIIISQINGTNMQANKLNNLTWCMVWYLGFLCYVIFLYLHFSLLYD